MSRKRAAPPTPAPRSMGSRAALRWVAALLVVHAALAGWAIARNSVTFDENFHLPAGLLILERHDYSGSIAQPPLPKVLYAIPALLLGARLPHDAGMDSGDEATVGQSFMRANRARYTTLYDASRLVALLFSIALGLLVWRWARRVHGEAGGVLALALYALLPETIAHAGIVGTDLPTGLAFTAALYALWRFASEPGRRTWGVLALAWAAAFLVRFSAVQLVPVFLLVALAAHATGRTTSPRGLWIGLALLVPLTWIAITAGYGFSLDLGPWSRLPLRSPPFLELVRRHPGFSFPLPDAFIAGLDYMLMLNQQAVTYLLGRLHPGGVWYYFPLALLVKLPLGFWGAVAARAVVRAKHERVPGIPASWVLGIAAGVFLVMALFFTRYNFGIRYLFPLLPLACIWCGGLLAPGAPAALRRLAPALVVLLAVETGLAAPWFLSFYNWPSGGPGGGDRVVNDSNVDWGQGLIALRDELAKRGIRRVYLTYHGTTDPAVYGIDYVPYLGGPVGTESDWMAVSSYYYRGLAQRMMIPGGRTAQPVRIDFSALARLRPAARPAECMYLFHLPPRR